MTDTISVILPVESYLSGSTSHPTGNRLTIREVGGKTVFNAPYAPREVTYSNFARTWTEVPRDGRRPYLVMENIQLPKISFSLTIARKDAYWDATNELKILKALSYTTLPLQISYGGWFESVYKWRMTNFSFTSKYRHPTTDAITHAEVDLEFTIVQDVVLASGPIKGGVKPGKPKKKSPSKPVKKPSSKPTTRVYTVKRGDTLTKIAIRLFKNASKWRYIADKNKIKNPNKLRVGQKLRY